MRKPAWVYRGEVAQLTFLPVFFKVITGLLFATPVFGGRPRLVDVFGGAGVSLFLELAVIKPHLYRSCLRLFPIACVCFQTACQIGAEVGRNR